MNSFSIKFQTAEVIPPPFSHAIEIQGNIQQNQALELSFDLQYLDRNTLTLDEIEEEGFTGEDDFQWKGTLPSTWADIIFGQLKSSKPMAITLLGEVQDFWEINFNSKTFFPENMEEWKYFLEEIRQAVYEKAGLEMPMKLTFLKIFGNSTIQNELAASFEKREFSLREIKTQKVHILPWAELNYYLKNIFSADFHVEAAQSKMPAKNGTFLNLGDEFWYEFGKSVKGNYKKIELLFTI